MRLILIFLLFQKKIAIIVCLLVVLLIIALVLAFQFA